MFYVYRITTSDGGQYVGCTEDLDMRLRAHLSRDKITSSTVRKYCQRYNVEVVETEILAQFRLKQLAKAREVKEIRALERPLNDMTYCLPNEAVKPLTPGAERELLEALSSPIMRVKEEE